MIAADGFPPLLLERLSRDHARIAGVVRQLADLVDEPDDEPDWSGIAEYVDFLDYYADKVHHSLEDRIFDYLVNKGLTPTERHLVRKNLGQHAQIIGMTEDLARSTARAVEGAPIDVSELIEALQAYIALQMRHMRFEEQQLFPLLEQSLENADWNELTKVVDVPEHDEFAHQTPDAMTPAAMKEE